MLRNHSDYYLRRILLADANKRFITSTSKFNTPSRTLEEYIKQDIDCEEAGKYITYLFGKEETALGIARMKQMSYEEFKEEVLRNNYFNYDEIKEFANLRVVLYMSRVGVSNSINGLGFGTMLRSFLDGHARITFEQFLLYAKVNKKMLESLIRTKGKKEFFEKYLVSRELNDKNWGHYWVILRVFNHL